MRLPDYTVKIIETLENAGFEAFAVGGCVRDMLMNRMPSCEECTAVRSLSGRSRPVRC